MKWLAQLWVLSACYGWLPSTWLVMAQGWWWLVASCAVCVASLGCPVRRYLTEPRLLVALMLAPAAGWALRNITVLMWVSTLILTVSAGWWLIVCGEQAWLERGITVAACGSLLWWAASLVWPLGIPLGRRAVWSALLGAASMNATGYPALGWACLSVLTGSFTGWVVPVARLLPWRWKHPLTWVTFGGVAWLTGRLWWPRFFLRWRVWSHLAWWTRHWVAGWGLGPIPGGFQDSTVMHGAEILSSSLDLHSTWLDALVRGGVLGLLSLVAVMLWAARRSAEHDRMDRWAFAVWVMSWQSVGAAPPLLCLGLIWLLGCCQPKEVSHAMAPS